MQAYSRRQRMYPVTMLYLGVLIGSTSWTVVGTTHCRAEDPAASSVSVRTLKGAGSIQYAPVGEGISLRMLKGVQHTDYALRPRSKVPTSPPVRTIYRTSSAHSSDVIVSNQGSRPPGIALPPIGEAHDFEARPRRWESGSSSKVATAVFEGEKKKESLHPNSPESRTSANNSIVSANKTREADATGSEHVATEKSEAHSTNPVTHSQRESDVAKPPPPMLLTPTNAAMSPATPRSEGQEWPNRQALYQLVLWQAIGTISASFIVSSVIVASLFFFLRRLRGQLGTLVRVDAPPIAASLEQSQAQFVPDVFVEETTAQPFDLGPTYEEQRLLNEENEQRQEQAVLRTIFEENLDLRRQLIECETTAV